MPTKPRHSPFSAKSQSPLFMSYTRSSIWWTSEYAAGIIFAASSFSVSFGMPNFVFPKFSPVIVVMPSQYRSDVKFSFFVSSRAWNDFTIRSVSSPSASRFSRTWKFPLSRRFIVTRWRIFA